MSGAFTDEHEEIRRYVRQWLDERAPIDVVRKTMETEAGFNPSLWSDLGELGWLGMALDEDFGGGGLGFMELAVVAEEMGRTLFPSPFLSTVVIGAGLVAGVATKEQSRSILPDVAGGALRLAAAVAPAARVSVAGTEVDGGWRLTGEAGFVLDGHTADLLIVEAGVAGESRLFLVEMGAEGLEARPDSVLDLTRPMARVSVEGTPARPLGEGDEDVEAAREEMVVRAVGALAMEQVGGAQACLDLSVEYAKDRHQFGRPIGSFQAVKHMCADMLVEVESARSAAYHLAWAIDHDPGEARIAAPLAKAYCADAYYRAAASTIQIHGGIGFTWEHHAHLHLKRAKSGQLLFGDSVYHRTRLADRLGIG
ncbi:MAG TPA: acyl-CoA dehydrogenase family protein [Acidimicrobiia bacterium]|nr:acyl-CoA dehydrogenase family protein [Acidimicrobiia bacterium]